MISRGNGIDGGGREYMGDKCYGENKIKNKNEISILFFFMPSVLFVIVTNFKNVYSSL